MPEDNRTSAGAQQPVRSTADAGRTEPAKADQHTTSQQPKASGDGVVLQVGESAVFPMIFTDDYVGMLGPMAAPGAGQSTDEDANVAKSAVTLNPGPPAQAIMRIDGLNVGKSVVTYRYDTAEVAIPVEVVRRVAKSVSFDPNGVARSPT